MKNQLINLQYKYACRFQLSIVLVPLGVLNLATRMTVESEDEEAG